MSVKDLNSLLLLYCLSLKYGCHQLGFEAQKGKFLLTDTSKYFHTWSCFPIILYLIFGKSVLEYSYSCFYFSAADYFPVDKTVVVVGYYGKACAVIYVVSLKDEEGFISENGKTLPSF